MWPDDIGQKCGNSTGKKLYGVRIVLLHNGSKEVLIESQLFASNSSMDAEEWYKKLDYVHNKLIVELVEYIRTEEELKVKTVTTLKLEGQEKEQEEEYIV